MNIRQNDQGDWNVLDLLAEPENGSTSSTSLTVEEIACRDMKVEWAIGSTVSGSMHINEATCIIPYAGRIRVGRDLDRMRSERECHSWHVACLHIEFGHLA